MNQDVILNVGRSYQSLCPVCRQKLCIGVGPGGKGYTYPAHYGLPIKGQRPGQTCDGSGRLVCKPELERLASS